MPNARPNGSPLAHIGPLWRPRTEEIVRTKADQNGGYLRIATDQR